MTANRHERLIGAVSPARAARAHKEACEFAFFRDRFNLEETADATTLYLTWLVERDLTSRQIRVRLQLLDLDRRLRGHSPWLQDPAVRLVLAGLYSTKSVGEGSSNFDPLYLELVHAMIDVCGAPSPAQRRALAAQVLRAETGISATELARLTWNDLRLGRAQLELTTTARSGRGPAVTTTLTVHARPGDPECPVAAVRALRSLDDGVHPFGSGGKPIDANRLRRSLGRANPLAPTPAQVRDPALLLLGYGCGLRTTEAMQLRQRDVGSQDRGLVLAIAGRRRLTFLPSAPGGAYDPRAVWMTWLKMLEQNGQRHPDGYAFRATNFDVVFAKGMHESGLNRMIHQRASEAGLTGRYVWTSLRSGMIRTAIRGQMQPYVIAGHADLASLTAVQRHERRENLLGSSSIAGRLGL